MPWGKPPQCLEGIAGSWLVRETAAADDLLGCHRQGGPSAQVAAVAIQPDQAFLAVGMGQLVRERLGLLPGQFKPLWADHAAVELQRSGRPASRSAASRMRQLSQTPQGCVPPL